MGIVGDDLNLKFLFVLCEPTALFKLLFMFYLPQWEMAFYYLRSADRTSICILAFYYHQFPPPTLLAFCVIPTTTFCSVVEFRSMNWW